MPKKGERTRRSKQLKDARGARKLFLGQPGPRADPYPPPGEWVSARVEKRLLPQPLEPPKKKMRMAGSGGDSKVMTAREERQWGAVLRASVLRADCAARHKRCPRSQMEKIAASVGVGVRTLDKLINRALRTGSLARIPGQRDVPQLLFPD